VGYTLHITPDGWLRHHHLPQMQLVCTRVSDGESVWVSFAHEGRRERGIWGPGGCLQSVVVFPALSSPVEQYATGALTRSVNDKESCGAHTRTCARAQTARAQRSDAPNARDNALMHSNAATFCAGSKTPALARCIDMLPTRTPTAVHAQSPLRAERRAVKRAAHGTACRDGLRHAAPAWRWCGIAAKQA